MWARSDGSIVTGTPYSLVVLGMELRELLMAQTTASGAGVDPARITLAAGRPLPGASRDRDEQVTVPQPWKWNGSPARSA
jgi:hypothetical protein